MTPDELQTLYPPVGERARAKVIGRIDPHMARFISLSPFCVLATVGPDGTLDASPRGGPPGFVRVEGERHLLMPDRPGNNRLDSLRNVVGGSGEVALMFLLPGMDEIVRVAGRATPTTEDAVLDALVEFGKRPRSALRIEVREAFLHCGKAVMRARLWEPEAQIERSLFPSIAEMIHDQTGVGGGETQAAMLARYKDTL